MKVPVKDDRQMKSTMLWLSKAKRVPPTISFSGKIVCEFYIWNGYARLVKRIQDKAWQQSKPTWKDPWIAKLPLRYAT
eukprot:1710070-Amphidinium_carterae.2